jgi:peptide/nickel transport system substrate-binding protein
MKKIFAVLITVMLLAAFTACRNDAVVQPGPNVTPPTTNNPASNQPATTPGTTPAAPAAPGEVFTGVYGMLDGRSRDQVLAELDNFPTPTGTITWASTTHPDSNIGLWGWSNPVPNARARDMFHGLSTVVTDFAGAMWANPMVVREFSSVDNTDGTRTFTVTIYDDLLWSDGARITGHDYVFNFMLNGSPAFKALDTSLADGFRLHGYTEYTNGETPFHAGINLHSDEFTFSLTIAAEHIPFFFEELFISLYPLPMHVIAPGVTMTDNGQGAIFSDNFTLELLIQTINDPQTGYRFNPSVVSGPYGFHSWDESARVLILEANPNFIGTFDGFRPRFERIVIREVSQAVLIDTLAAGEIDVISGVRGGVSIEPGLELTRTGSHWYVNYPRDGYGMIRFHGDQSPTQFPHVRQAIALLMDREEFARQFTGGHGALVHSAYALSQWTYLENRDELYSRLDPWAFNPVRAEELLIENGWTLDATGGPYVPGPGLVRHKEVDGELMPLVIEWLASSGNTVSDLITIFLLDEAARVGMRVNDTWVDSVLSAASRSGVTEPEFFMFNMGIGFGVPHQPWLATTNNPAFFGSQNPNFFADEELYGYAVAMRTTPPGDRAQFARHWLDFQERWNYVLPDLPLYADIDYDFIGASVDNWNNNSTWGMTNAIIRSAPAR